MTDQLAPLRLKLIGADSAPRNFPTSPATPAIGPPADPLAIAVIALLFGGSLIDDDTDRPVPLGHRFERQPEDDEAETIERYRAEAASFDLKRHGERA